jgi:hypothetical protein
MKLCSCLCCISSIKKQQPLILFKEKDRKMMDSLRLIVEQIPQYQSNPARPSCLLFDHSNVFDHIRRNVSA